MRTACLLVLVAILLSAASPPEPRLRWYKGNTHTHTLNSDGDSSPDEVVRWYRDHGYQFLVLSDHNFLTSVGGLNALHGVDEKFLVIPGEEVSDKFGGKPIHVNALNLRKLVEPQGGKSVVETIQRNVDAVRAAESVPHINHPNFMWAITADDLSRVSNDKLLEIYNGHPMVNNEGGGDRPGMEQVWDILLTRGKLIYGIAVDDAHHFKRPWDRDAARPGRGWVVVRAARLDAATLMAAMEKGDFYASTGVELRDYTAAKDAITIDIRVSGETRYTTRYIGSKGKVLQESTTNPSVYRFRGNEGYVRASVTDSNGAKAWTQPVLLPKPVKTGS
ncbi:MAG TPA: CehA/McbA family metallohydrolase [Thermoanaerobaculia bacterium]|nr:CehA/McbA family metallohydrolase [Thermoanaerobaculia bacterium]